MSVDADVFLNDKRKHHQTSKDSTDIIEKSQKRKRRHDDALRETEAGESPPTKKHHSSKKRKILVTEERQSPPSSSVDQSSFHYQTSSLYLPLSPISQLHPLQSLCAEHLSPLILTYYHPFHGIVLSYKHVRLSESSELPCSRSQQGLVLARSIDEYAASFVWVTADFLIFRPQRGGWIEGWVNLQHEGHLGLVCWNLFNASIERKRLPRNWKWVPGGQNVGSKKKSDQPQNFLESGTPESVVQQPIVQDDQDSQGYYEDGRGKKIEGRIMFRVKDMEASPSSDRERSFVSIEGTLLDDEEEELILEQEIIRGQRASQGPFSARGPLVHSMSGVLTNGSNSNAVKIHESSRSNK